MVYGCRPAEKPLGRLSGLLDALLVAGLLLPGIGCATQPEAPTPDNPLPVLTRVTPSALQVGTTDLLLSITGQAFVSGTRGRWNESDRPTTVRSATNLEVTLSPEDVRRGGVGKLDVRNPPPGGGVSGFIEIPLVSPIPVLTSVSPPSGAIWQPASLTITGLGFVEGSILLLNGAQVAIASLQGTQLTAVTDPILIDQPRIMMLTVRNPQPGGGESNALDFPIEYRTPVIAQLQPATAQVLGPFDLTVRGSNFGPGTIVRLNGMDLNTTAIRHDLVFAHVRAENLPTPGNTAVTVLNPLPGGESAPATLRVGPTPPTSIAVFPSSVPAGTPGVTLTLFGRHFLPTSLVAWDNQPLATRFIDSSRLETDIPAAVLLVPTRVAVSVYGTPAAPTIGAVPFLVTPPGNRIRSLTIIEMENNDIAVDPLRNLIYASVPERIVGFSNSVVAFDVETGTPVWQLVVGDEPGVLAASEDGQWLYVVTKGDRTVARVDLVRRAVDLRITLDQLASEPIWGEGDLAVLSGEPRSFLLVLNLAGASKVAVFDDAALRPDTVSGVARVAPSANPSRFYATGTNTFYILDVTTTGVTLTPTGFYSPSFGGKIEFSDGKLFSTGGDVVDVGQVLLITTLPPATSLRADPLLNRLFHVQDSTLTVYDLHTLDVVDSLNIGYGAFSRRTLRIGADGLVFHNEARITVIRSPVIKP